MSVRVFDHRRRRAIGTNAINDQRVIFNAKAMFCGNGSLPIFDQRIEKFHDLSAFDANKMIVMVSAVEFEHRLSAFEMATAHQTYAFELGQYAINGRQSDLFVVIDEFPINILGTQMPLVAAFENPQNFDSGRSHLESGLFDLLIFQFVFPVMQWIRQDGLHPAFVNMRPRD